MLDAPAPSHLQNHALKLPMPAQMVLFSWQIAPRHAPSSRACHMLPVHILRSFCFSSAGAIPAVNPCDAVSESVSHAQEHYVLRPR